MTARQFVLLSLVFLFPGLPGLADPDPADALRRLGAEGLDRDLTGVEKKRLLAGFAALDATGQSYIWLAITSWLVLTAIASLTVPLLGIAFRHFKVSQTVE